MNPNITPSNKNPEASTANVGGSQGVINLAKTAVSNYTGESHEDDGPVLLGITKDGGEVYDRKDSHFHPEGGLTHKLLKQAIDQIDTQNRNDFKEVVEFDRPVGKTTCVEVGPEDDVVRVYRKGRDGQTPMVKNREAEPCNSVTVIMKKKRNAGARVYELRTAFIGGNSTKEPWDPSIADVDEYQEAKKFWDSHALLYDDNLIDQERTEAYENASEEEKVAEQIRQNVYYAGIFVNSDDINEHVQPKLRFPTKVLHITTKFKPKIEQLHLDQVGTKAKISVIGYGNDGENEGLLVNIHAEDPAIQEACDAIRIPHITLSLGKGGRAQDTAWLNFRELEEPFEIDGTFGLYSRNVITSQEELEKLKEEVQI